MILGFILGLVIGSFITTFIMCALNINKLNID